MKKPNLFLKIIVPSWLLAGPLVSLAAFDYQLLEDFPGVSGMTKGTVMTDLPALVSSVYKFGIWTVGIAAMFMLVIGGFMYMTSAGNTSRAGSAKEVIGDSLTGLITALAAFLLLYVINPDLTRINLNLIQVDVQNQQNLPGASSIPGATSDQVGCGKVVTAANNQKNAGWVYNQSLRGQTVNGVHYTDCSNFAQSAYASAGCKNPGSTTADQFANARTYNGPAELKAGDIIVKRGVGGNHAVICKTDGCGTIVHARGKDKGAPYIVDGQGSAAATKQGSWTGAKVIKAADLCGTAC